MYRIRLILKNALPFIAVSILFSITPTSANAQMMLYGIDNQIPFLSVVDPATGNELSFLEITIAGETFASGNGLAVNPVTNEMYAAVKLASQSGPGRNLLRIDPNTGIATNIGNMPQPIASMSFSSAGVLYGVTGDCSNNCGGSAVAETLFTINTDTAALTSFLTLGNGNDGEAIAYNPVDGMMYHMSGKGAGLIFEKINLSTKMVTPISLSGDSVANYEAIGFVYDSTQNLFVGSLIDWDVPTGIFFTLMPNGTLFNVDVLAFPWKDYAFHEFVVQDTDGDGVPDSEDAFPNDPTEWDDTDDEV